MAEFDWIVYAEIRVTAEDADGAEEIIQAALDTAEELTGTTSQIVAVELAKDH